jgi:hypothetical protein
MQVQGMSNKDVILLELVGIMFKLVLEGVAEICVQLLRLIRQFLNVLAEVFVNLVLVVRVIIWIQEQVVVEAVMFVV